MKIKNYSRFQHFKDRRPPWIKLYREILEQPDIMMISDWSFKVLVCLWLIASEDKHQQGNLPDVDTIAFRLHCSKDKIDKALRELVSFIDQDDNKTISSRYQDDAPETETETEKRQRGKKPAPAYRAFGHLSITEAEVEKIIKDLNVKRSDIDDILDDIENYKGSTKYKSLSLTARKWLKKRISSGEIITEAPITQTEMLRAREMMDEAARTPSVWDSVNDLGPDDELTEPDTTGDNNLLDAGHTDRGGAPEGNAVDHIRAGGERQEHTGNEHSGVECEEEDEVFF
jgi:hypothetical protein